jgi:hypothetical protein
MLLLKVALWFEKNDVTKLLMKRQLTSACPSLQQMRCQKSYHRNKAANMLPRPHPAHPTYPAEKKFHSPHPNNN